MSKISEAFGPASLELMQPVTSMVKEAMLMFFRGTVSDSFSDLL